jgi:hypothetical protein
MTLLQEPISHFRDAADAAKRVFLLKRDLAVLDAELQAKHQAKRLLTGVVSALLFTAALALALFWVGWAMHEAGVGSWTIAALSFATLGGLGALAAWLALRTSGVRAAEKAAESDPSAPRAVTEAAS